ncbi:CPBP family intramembrane glutamic endopeptidase [Methanoculleus frigidifontis]|uniref:CPBP family intramembrane glutamic endopeptidase n=1 Tax=Methanoculleus frigidifontis TaxID=2584085 RepID=UPI00265892C0|nr:CPBP family intramembrane glutamic endopeptidase [Methanoculleus sp. FWC-SCC1]
MLLGGGTEIGLFLGSAATLAPFVILAAVAYLSAVHPVLKYPAYLILLAVVLGLALLSFALGFVTILPPEVFLSETTDAAAVEEAITPQTAIGIFLLFCTSAGAALLSLTPLLRAVRVRLASRLDFSPDNRVHTIALVTVFALTLIPLVPVAVTGVPPYLSETFTAILNADTTFFEGAVSVDIYTLFWTIAASFVIVGLCTTRTLPETLQRLGLARPSAREVLLALGFGLALVAVFSLLDVAIGLVWEALGWPLTDTAAFERFLVPYLTPAGILVASISAGFGEEISVRGILQPRFGILLPALLFASLHAFQYNWDGILSVFIAGLVFGLIRSRYSTTVCAITHTTYDFVLFLGLLLGFGVI